MKVIARPIGTGKTKELLRTAIENNGIVFTNNKRALKVKADSYGFKDVEIIDWDDLLDHNYDENKPIYVHKLEDIMKEWLYSDYGLRLDGYSIALGE